MQPWIRKAIEPIAMCVSDIEILASRVFLMIYIPSPKPCELGLVESLK